MNSIFVIFPYKTNGVWVFDDESTGLVREAFVCGMGEILDALTKGIPDAERGFVCYFSASAIPGTSYRIDWRREESGGNWYYCGLTQTEGWLCPALFKYFAEAPKEIYIQAKAKKINTETSC